MTTAADRSIEGREALLDSPLNQVDGAYAQAGATLSTEAGQTAYKDATAAAAATGDTAADVLPNFHVSGLTEAAPAGRAATRELQPDLSTSGGHGI